METIGMPKLSYKEKMVLLYLFDSKVRYGEDRIWTRELHEVFGTSKHTSSLARKGLVKTKKVFCVQTWRYRRYIELTPAGEEIARKLYESLI